MTESLNHRKKMKAERSRLISRKHTETLVLLSVITTRSQKCRDCWWWKIDLYFRKTTLISYPRYASVKITHVIFSGSEKHFSNPTAAADSNNQTPVVCWSERNFMWLEKRPRL